MHKNSKGYYFEHGLCDRVQAQQQTYGAAEWLSSPKAVALGEVEGGELPGLVDGTFRKDHAAYYGIAHKLRMVLLLITISTAQTVLPGPSTQFTKLTFFAQRHGGGDCAFAPASEACREASSDVAVYHGVAGFVAHSFAWLSALMLGSYSDRFGRRPILVAKSVLSLLSVLSLATHVIGGVSLWLYLIMEPIITMFDINSVFLAVMSDLIQDPKQRVAAYSLIMGTSLAAGGPAGLLGGVLPARTAVCIAIALAIFHVAFLATEFPETAPQVLRGGAPDALDVSKDLRPLAVARDAADLLTRSPLIGRTTLVLVFSAVSATGFQSTFVPYLAAYFGFTQATNGKLMLVCAMSIAVAFLIGLRPLLARFGEFGTMRRCLGLKVTFYLLCSLAWNQTQLFAIHAIFVGPVLLIFPIMSTVQTTLVGEEEQGRMQGVLAACKVLATAMGDVCFGWLYKYSTSSGTDPHRTAVLPPLLVASGFAAAAFVVALPLNGEGALELHGAKHDRLGSKSF